MCLPATPYRLGSGRVLPPISGVQRQSGVKILQRPGTPGRLPGKHTLSLHTALDSDTRTACTRLQKQRRLCVSDVRLQSRHVEFGLHAGQYDFPERALLPWTRQL